MDIRNVLFNDALNMIYLRLYEREREREREKEREREREREREMFYLMTHSTHFIYGYIASDIWLRTILIVRKETRCRHIGYSYRLTARVLLCAPSHRQDNTYHGLCYTSRGALAGTINSSMGIRGQRLSFYLGKIISEKPTDIFIILKWLEREIAQWIHLQDRSDDPSHHERTLELHLTD